MLWIHSIAMVTKAWELQIHFKSVESVQCDSLKWFARHVVYISAIQIRLSLESLRVNRIETYSAARELA